MNDLTKSAIAKLQRYANARDRRVDYETRDITITDDEAIALLRAVEEGPMTDRGALRGMLLHAEAARSYMALSVITRESGPIIVSTGPDDADAVFFFDGSGRLTHVAVVEAHGDLEADMPPLAITEDRRSEDR